MKPILRALYSRYRPVFQDFLVEDLIGQVPTDIREPAISFLSKGKQQLTKYLLFQAYFLQRKSITDVGNAERYHGMLIMVKFMLSLVADAPIRDEASSTVEVTPAVKDPTLAVKDFYDGFQKRRKADSNKAS